jgi:hypothetical protein
MNVIRFNPNDTMLYISNFLSAFVKDEEVVYEMSEGWRTQPWLKQIKKISVPACFLPDEFEFLEYYISVWGGSRWGNSRTWKSGLLFKKVAQPVQSGVEGVPGERGTLGQV